MLDCWIICVPNGIVLMLLNITPPRCRFIKVRHMYWASIRDRILDTNLVDDKLILYFFGFVERSSCSRRQSGILFGAQPVGSGQGKRVPAKVLKVDYSELQLTLYRAIGGCLVPLLCLFELAIGRASHCVNFRGPRPLKCWCSPNRCMSQNRCRVIKSGGFWRLSC